MNVCGVLVHAHPMRLDDVVAAMRGLDGLEIHEQAEGGRFVITIEDTTETHAIDTLTAIQKIKGIVSAALVYHSFEPAIDAAAHA